MTTISSKMQLFSKFSFTILSLPSQNSENCHCSFVKHPVPLAIRGVDKVPFWQIS